MNRRDTTYYGLFGNITESEANYVDYQLDEILVAGDQNVVVSILFGAWLSRSSDRVRVLMSRR